MARLAGLALLATLALAACSSIKTSSTHASDVDFSALQSFAMGEVNEQAVQGLPDYGIEDAVRFERRIAEGFVEEGLREVAADEAQVLITFRVDSKLEQTTWGRNTSEWTEIEVYDDSYTAQWTKGKLRVEMRLAGSERLVWSAEASADLPEARADRRKMAYKGIEKVLDRYPPKK